MNIQEYADTINEDIILSRPHNAYGWNAQFRNAEIKKGSILIGEWGKGNTPNQAINDYVCKIVGKLIVFNAMGSNRKSFVVPESLTGIL